LWAFSSCFPPGIPVAFSIGYTCLMVIIAGSGLKDLSFDLFACR